MQGHLPHLKAVPDETPARGHVPAHVTTHRPEYVWFRLAPGVDPLEGIAEVARGLDARGGSIVQCMGSLSELHYIMAVPDPEGGWKFSDPVVVPGPMEFMASQGTWGRDADSGELVVHLHGLVVDAQGVAHGGHLVPGSKVLATCEVGLLTGPGVAIERHFDAAAGRPILGLK